MITIEQVQTLTLEPTDIVVLKIDTGNYPKSKAEEFMRNVADSLRTKFENKVIVMDSKCDIIKVTRKELEENP